jgi:hypothetical protein
MNMLAVLTESLMQHLGAEAAQQQQRHDYYKILGILPTAQVILKLDHRRPPPHANLSPPSKHASLKGNYSGARGACR